MKLKLIIIIIICVACNKKIINCRAIEGTYTFTLKGVPFYDKSYLRLSPDSMFAYGQTIEGTTFLVSGQYILNGKNIIFNTLKEETYFAVPNIPDNFYQKIDTAIILNGKKILFNDKVFKRN